MYSYIIRPVVPKKDGRETYISHLGHLLLFDSVVVVASLIKRIAVPRLLSPARVEPAPTWLLHVFVPRFGRLS